MDSDAGDRTGDELATTFAIGIIERHSHLYSLRIRSIGDL
jgi:hypothetical protein